LLCLVERFQPQILDVPSFVQGGYNTHFIQDNAEALKSKVSSDTTQEDIAALVAFTDYLDGIEQSQIQNHAEKSDSTWKLFGRKKNVNRL